MKERNRLVQLVFFFNFLLEYSYFTILCSFLLCSFQLCIYVCWWWHLFTTLYPTVLQPHGWSQPGSSVHGVSQARALERVVISFSRGSSWPRDQASIPALAGRFSTPEPPRKPIHTHRFPLFGFPSHLSHLGAEFPVLYRRFSLVIYV